MKPEIRADRKNDNCSVLVVQCLVKKKQPGPNFTLIFKKVS